jgi:RimJ/RimL family protein N-acetyltransferase
VALAPPAPSPLAPVLSNHDLRLTPVEPDDVRFLYSLATHPETCYRWRYRGVPPQTDRFLADLWAQVLVQFVARRTEDGEPVGHVVAYGADLGQGYAYLGAVFRPPYSGSGLAAQGSAMFIRYLFHAFALRKLYIEVPGFNWPQLSSGEGKLFQVEGIMRDHEHYAGRYWDRYLCAVYPRAIAR